MVVASRDRVKKWMPAPARFLGGDRTRTSDLWLGVFVAGCPSVQVLERAMIIQTGRCD